ncbi:MAG: AAA family ATPase [Synergistaceae bacterium]|nr:AAA family ATPase [Synergistaceae bacterium]
MMSKDYVFDIGKLQNEVADFIHSVGIEPIGEVDFIFDGSLHRFSVKGDKHGEETGWYVLYSDGWPAGKVGNWRTGVSEKWKADIERLTDDEYNYFNSKEYQAEIKRSQKHRAELEKELERKVAEKTERSRIYFESLPKCSTTFPYLMKKDILPLGDLRYCDNRKAIAVPLYNAKGKFCSLQWIYEDGTKRFEYETSTKGAFFPLGFKALKDDKDNKLPILIGEGVATMITVFTSLDCKFPCVAAMNCGNLKNVAEDIKKVWSSKKIIIIADNDKRKERKDGINSGIVAAQEVVDKKLAVGFVAPELVNDKEIERISDWNDYFVIHGEADTKQVIQEKVDLLCMSKEEREEYQERHELRKLITLLDPSIQIEPQEFIGGMYPRRFVSAIVAPSGTGKTMYMQKNVSDLSMGGSIFDGFVEDEPPRKCLIFAGEAGYEMLLRRGAQTRWPINPLNVPVIDQYKFESAGKSVMLDTEEGWANTRRIIDITKPDVVFWDTFTSFHEKDENKATEMKPIIKNITESARNNNYAAVLVHHSRKRSAKERTLSLSQDDVIGSSVFNRLVALIIGIEPLSSEGLDATGEKPPLLVRPLKTWFSAFMPFTYKIAEDINGRTVIQTDLAPASVGNSKIAVYNYLRANFKPDEWFSISNIAVSEINPVVTPRQLKRVLADLAKNGKLHRRGETRGVEYSVVGFYDLPH